MKLFSLNSESGFSLIEVLIALLILSIVIAGGGLFFFYARCAIVREGHRRVALQTASQKIEELKATSYEKILESMPFPKEEVDNLPSGNTITTEIEDLGGYLEATVTVSWQNNSPQKVSLVTLIASR
ncbi:type II secretion system protein [Candidatus Aerophobetes bacterium]|uniref:Type II secretion system protein n=1 Tax=Aerophobetes bacterium TaxID=2030807 RepID=A0A523RZ19_UNCAE|nr:MAG: type II secretion system protein [Candidatus Aerophobetes bacterium]